MRADVIIVGAGLAGSAAAWELIRRGREVVLLERFEPGHTRGSSHGSARIFRRAYPDPLYVQLTGLAGERWRELEAEAGEELVHLTGSIDFGPSPVPKQMHDLLRTQHIPAELLTPAAAAERWPGFVFAADDEILFHPDGGVIDPDRAMAAMQRLAAAGGAEIRHNTPVTSIEADVAGAVVRTEGMVFEAAVVVVAAGAWLEPLLGGQVTLPPLKVTQEQYFQFEGAGQWPAFIYHADSPVYGLLANQAGHVKVGIHGQGMVTTGDTRDSLASNVARERVRQFVMTKVPGLDPAPRHEGTCLYTSTGNTDFILDRRGPFVIASACSGHGAKFAPLTGAIIADLADGRAQPEPRFTLELPGTFPAQSASLLAGTMPRP
jgi:sarcosine oxidase